VSSFVSRSTPGLGAFHAGAGLVYLSQDWHGALMM